MDLHNKKMDGTKKTDGTKRRSSISANEKHSKRRSSITANGEKQPKEKEVPKDFKNKYKFNKLLSNDNNRFDQYQTI
jgi:hypothetical protein